MCGIAGFAQLAVGDDEAARLLDAMTTALAHRGPDGHGRYWRGGVGLAHTRLAIVDVARGVQPSVRSKSVTRLQANTTVLKRASVAQNL